MKISIIIPAHNEEKRISKTLEEYLKFFEKLKKEKILDFEILIVLNACTDSSLDIVKKYEKLHKEIRYLNFKKGGKGFAITEGFKDALKRENDLINNRMTWLLTTQALLFAALEYVKNTNKLEFVVSIVGLSSSIGFLLCILAAIIAYFRFYLKTPRELKKDDFPETNRNILILLLGFGGPILTPIILIWGWSYILLN